MAVSNQMIDHWLEEDIPYFDLTTHLLGIGQQKGSISYVCRHTITLACVEDAVRILERQHIHVTTCLPSGTQVEAGEVFLRGEGTVENLHTAWKVTQNLLEYACGISTRTKQLVDTAKAVNPEIAVFTTRKSFPGTKQVSIQAVLAGGALPHRLGLSETILIFDQHLRYMGGYDGLAARLPILKKSICDKSISVEVDTLEHALLLVRAGVDALQFDKVEPTKLMEMIQQIRAENTRVMLIAAGGINASNAAAYAATGVDAISTTWAYFGKPADITIKME
ncbi:ModD protein [Ethanoligenens sp.]|uniref:ModD protein n=1 Tax=Ethanoligenens sp. TaxID=2099655 RepID=UPI0039E8C574